MTGRCYCGACSISGERILTVSYCHCVDCRRWTGAPVAAFAALPRDQVSLPEGASRLASGNGVERWTCTTCGSPLASAFDYLPGQIYLPLGILDEAAHLPPRLHAHSQSRLPWLHINDDLPRPRGSARDTLNASG